MHRSSSRLALLALALAVPSVQAFEVTRMCKTDQREVRVATVYGTIQNLDIAPDGKRMVFDLLGDIYVMPTSGGRAVALTRGTDWDVRPVWSPDGKYVAFISDRSGVDRVFLIDPSEADLVRQVGLGKDLSPNEAAGTIGAAEWAPDSSALMIDGTLVSIRSDATKSSRASAVKGGVYHGNGTALFHFRPLPRSGKSKVKAHAVWQAGPSGGNWRDTAELLYDAYTSSQEAPLVSRDGRWLVYKQRASVAETRIPGFKSAAGQVQVDIVRVRDRRSGVTRVLVGPGMSPGWRDNGRGEGEYPARGRFAITPDSKFLIAPYAGELHRIDLATGKSSPIAASIDIAQCLEPMVRTEIKVDREPRFLVRNFRGTTMHPGRKQLAFSALRRLYVTNERGGSPSVLVSQLVGQFQPAYSPDGKWIAYVSWSEAQGGHIWRVPSTGGKPERLTQEAGYYQTPVWSPDGTSIAFVGSDEIAARRSGYSVNVYGGSLQLLSLRDHSIHRFPVVARLGHPPAFSADGERIWYAPFTGVSNVEVSLSSIGRSGIQARIAMPEMLLPRGGAAAAVPSPDGRLLATIEDGNLHLVRCKQDIESQSFRGTDCKKKRVTHAGAYDPRWRGNGSHLEWGFGDTHYRVKTSRLLEWMEDDKEAFFPDSHIESTAIALSVRRQTGKGVAVLTGARVITMRGDEVIENGAVRIEDGRIIEVGRAGEVAIPSGALEIDVRGKTLLPGFVDAHAHHNEMPRDLLDGNNEELLLDLAYGITTAKDPSNGGDHAYAYTELLKTGEMVGPRLFGSEGLVSTYQTIDSLDDAIGIARRTQRLGGTFLKYHTGFSRQQRRWIMQAARQTGLGVAAHWAPTNYSPGRLDFTTIVDGAMTSEHEFSEGLHVSSDVVDFIARSKIYLSFTPIALPSYPLQYWDQLRKDPRMVRFYRGEEPTKIDLPPPDTDANGLPALSRDKEKEVKLVAAIARAGGNVTIGSHGNYDGIGFHWEMWAHVRGGMSPHEVLRAATIQGARATGVSADLGSIEPGKLADLDKNPLEDIRHSVSVERVMLGGVLRDALTLDEVWPVRRPLPAWRFESSRRSADRNDR